MLSIPSPSFAGCSVIGLGEVLWDQLPQQDGSVAVRLGGAPANFAVACARLGARVAIASGIGHDELGDATLAALSFEGAITEYVQRNPLHTSEVKVALRPDGHATYTIEQPVAWDALAWTDAWQSLARDAEAVCFGTLAQRAPDSRDAIRRFVVETRPEAVRVFDVNLRTPFWDAETLEWGLQHATILKLNEDELPIMLAATGLPAQTDEAVAARSLLAAGRQLQLVCLTLGGRGCLLTTRQQQVHHAGFATEVKDTVGAGDAFTAAMVTYWMREAPLAGIAAAANRLGSFVASQQGAMPQIPAQLLRHLDTLAQQED